MPNYAGLKALERSNTVVVRAVGIAVANSDGVKTDHARALEATMAEAVEQAVREGVSLEHDGEEIKRRMAAAGQREGLERVLAY